MFELYRLRRLKRQLQEARATYESLPQDLREELDMVSGYDRVCWFTTKEKYIDMQLKRLLASYRT